MARNVKNVLLVFDLLEAPDGNQDYRFDLKDENWKSEANVKSTLEQLGYNVSLLGLYDQLQPLFDAVQKKRPDYIFNLSESFDGVRRFEPNIAGVFELMQIPFTGADFFSLALCKNKAFSKQFSGFNVPAFEVFEQNDSPTKQKIGSRVKNYPAIVKPLRLESSQGISMHSLVKNDAQCLKRIQYIHKSFAEDAIVEQYIEGRELYLSVFCNSQGFVFFPARELIFKNIKNKMHCFATYKAKWNTAYRKKWGIQTIAMHDSALIFSPDVLRRCKQMLRKVSMTGYCRMDFRLSPDGELFLIEMNPNPSIAKDDDFALSAKSYGWSYVELIAEILKAAKKRLA